MRKRIAIVGALVAALSLVPGAVASACPDPDNPCDPPPPQPLPLWCKLTPFC
ncbi:MAG TPA: hypothetical protein VG318_11185 [Actinomycetota bacterium]|nr:hypothetical protein [Actinomycetota bacterium]